jgi:Sulfotransferase domain
MADRGSSWTTVTTRAHRVAARATSRLRALPDFVIIGSQKAGTTSLRNHMSEHPDVYSASEIHYLDRYFERGPHWYRSWFPLQSTLRRHERRTGHRAVSGEKTPEYIFIAGGAEHLHALVPQARLIVALRDPVERAFSQWRAASRRGIEARPFPDALAAEPDDAPPPTAPVQGSELFTRGYIARGRYADRLEPWLDRYDREQVFIYRCEDLFEAPDVWVPRILEHVGVDPRGLDGVKFPRALQGEPGRIDPVVRDGLVERFREPDVRLRELTGLSYF